ncbi:hypothetical protein RHGRI_005494 [Rhododendron griersonianum]|uniref:Uncharacterized protein n=1 Tax=Rhododendron griersonianum TaxID=479676 RepID=A0AAV6LDH9_9ERIC|nr:hypothetical protein RHGRI_005494 [Rhododendron griersonianum]
MVSQGDNNEGYNSIEIEDSNSRLVTSVRGMIDAVPPISPDCCINRAPQGVRQLNEKAYAPQRVSIGPLHHGKENLLPMEEQKLRYLSAFLDRNKLSLEDCIRFVSGLEQRVRDCYLESVNLGSDEFVKMILVNSSFIIEVIWRTYYQMPENNMDYLSNRISRVDVVQRDMILLENQIPHFAIADLFNLAFPHHPKTERSGPSVIVEDDEDMEHEDSSDKEDENFVNEEVIHDLNENDNANENKGDIDMASQGAKSEDYSSIEIENSDSRLVTSVRGMIDALSPISPDHCIYRAPQSVRQLNEKFYTPQKVSIGPLHHGKENLLPMEEQKLRYLSTFLDRTELSLEDCISFVRGLEQRVRNCYVESVSLSSDEFVKMIIVDSSFVIEVIWRYNFLMQQNETDYLSKPISLVDVVRRDMILLENQIPLFVIEGLFNLALPHLPKTGELSFVQLSINYYFRSASQQNHIPQTSSNSEVKHFVDLLRLCHLPSTLRSLPPNGVEFATIPTARDLQEVGLSIRKGSCSNKLDIQYAEGVLTIPQFGVNDDSEFELRNLIAFEICHCLSDSYIIDYVVFMDSLMDTTQDVDILVQDKIFESLLFDRASVATLFHNLTLGVMWFASNYYYSGLCQKVNAYCKVPWNKWKAIMKHDYFSTPWRIVSIVAAVILLVLTLIQAVCSVISILQ